MKKKSVKKKHKSGKARKTPGFKPDRLDKVEIVKHANFIEYLANKKIHVVEKKDNKGEKFLHLSKSLSPDLKKKIINNLLRNYADADSINRAVEDYQFENKPRKKRR
ncbi:MAG TPA: hypothetical protein VMC07_00655 [Candidatus Omnitrophota bacterium]|nr:hypothetical protein [Candidatus Omnitrophota bacterium]